MKLRLHFAGTVIPLLLLPLVLFSIAPLAVGQDASAQTEQIELSVGDILEILPAHNIINASYSWILTQDRTFIQAGRAPEFRARLIQPGTYTLIADITSPDSVQRIHKTFTITMRQRTKPAGTGTAAQTASGNTLVHTIPSLDRNKHLVLQDGHALVRLDPLSTDIQPLALDLDTTRDSDGNGNPGDDVDDRDTFFQTYASPLTIWFTEPVTERTMTVTAAGVSGGAVVQQITILGEQFAKEQGLLVNPVQITIEETGGRNYTFNAIFQNTVPTSTPFLFHWNFGDGTESLLQNPAHTYAANGSYTVSLQVRDLLNGKEAGNESKTVTVQSDEVTSSPSQASSSSITSVPTSSTGHSLKSILILIGVFLLFLVIGSVGVTLFFRLRKGKSLDEPIVEQKKTDTPAVLSIPTIPVQSGPKQVSAQPQKSTAEQTSTAQSKAVTPKIDTDAAPAWLKKGLGDSAAPAAPAPKESPAPRPTPAPTPAAPKPAPVVAPAKPIPAPTPKPTQPAAPAPAPVRTPPTPMPAQVTPAPAPMPATTPLPPWLQTAPEVSQAKPAPTPAPAPIPTPVPVTPKPQAPIPTPVPVTPKPQAPTPAPAPASKPVAPVPVPQPIASPVVQNSAPIPAPKPAPVSTPIPQSPSPTSQPILPAESKQATPATPVTPAATPADQPIAIIRAESLEKKPEEPQSPVQPK